MRSIQNTLILLFCVVLLGAGGHYLTNVKQPEALQKIDDTIQLAKLEQAEVSKLLVDHASSRAAAEASLAKWNSRYKEIPAAMNTADMVLYLESLTASGFDQFDIDLAGQTDTPDFSYYTFKVKALSTFTQMYHFVWHIENNREFYRINDLKVTHRTVYKDNSATKIPKRYDVVDFSFNLDAYFNAKYGIAASEDELIAVPQELLPKHDPTHNSFYPLIRTDLPPNDELLLDIEKATLVSVVGDRAIFEGEKYSHIVAAGDRIYLGKVIQVDSRTATVIVEQNKGGRTFTIDLHLEVELLDVIGRSGISVQPTDN